MSANRLVRVYEQYGGAVISAVRIQNKEDLKHYGIAEVEPVEGNIYKITHIVEKPQPDQAPSNLATIGAYILPPEIFALLCQQRPGTGGESGCRKLSPHLSAPGILSMPVKLSTGDTMIPETS